MAPETSAETASQAQHVTLAAPGVAATPKEIDEVPPSVKLSTYHRIDTVLPSTGEDRSQLLLLNLG